MMHANCRLSSPAGPRCRPRTALCLRCLCGRCWGDHGVPPGAPVCVHGHSCPPQRRPHPHQHLHVHHSPAAPRGWGTGGAAWCYQAVVSYRRVQLFSVHATLHVSLSLHLGCVQVSTFDRDSSQTSVTPAWRDAVIHVAAPVGFDFQNSTQAGIQQVFGVRCTAGTLGERALCCTHTRTSPAPWSALRWVNVFSVSHMLPPHALFAPFILPALSYSLHLSPQCCACWTDRQLLWGRATRGLPHVGRVLVRV